MKKKSKVLLTSAASIAMCASMIVGGTYALFTSESEVNITVASAKVDVKATVSDEVTYYVNDVQENWTYGSVTITNGNTVAFDKMTPGDRAEFTINIQNNSDIPVKYRTVVAFVDDKDDAYDLTFFQGLEVSINGVQTSYNLDWEQVSVWEELAVGTNPETVTVSIGLPCRGDEIDNLYNGKTTKIVYRVEAVQGTAQTEDSDPNVTLIYNATQLVNFASDVNGGNKYTGKTVKLTNSIDLGGMEWTPIGTNADNANKFYGTFDGQGFTISNFVVNQEADYHAAGFFGALNGTAKNFTIDNASITSISSGNKDGNTDNGNAVVAGSIYNKGTIENVTVKNSSVTANRYVGAIAGYTYGNVKNCTVDNVTLTAATDTLTGKADNGDKVGGIVGYFADESTYVVSGNTVTNSTLKGYRDVGGIAGYVSGAMTSVTKNTVENVTLILDNTNDYKGCGTVYSKYDINPIIGDSEGKTVNSSNKSSNVTISISLTDDVTISNTITVPTGAKFVLDGGDNTITADVGDSVLINGNNLEISNVTITGTAKYAIYRVGGTATLTNVTVNMEGAYVLNFYGGGTATLNNCTVKGTAPDEDTNYGRAKIWVGDAVTLTVNGGTYSSIFVNVSSGGGAFSAGTIIVNSGTIAKLTLETEVNDKTNPTGYKSATLIQTGGTITKLVENPQNYDLTDLEKLN